jgi:parallel beta-helix repeat protein
VTIERYSGDTPGIYVDEKGTHRIIEYNTVIGSHMAGIFSHWAPGNVVQKNTVYGNKGSQVFFTGNNRPEEILVDDILLDNIMFATDAQQRTLHLSMNYDNVCFGQSDRNYFYNPYRSTHILVNRYNAHGAGWIRRDLTLQQWCLLSGYDEDSREFASLDRFPEISIEYPRKSRIVYNASLSPTRIDLQSDKYCDVEGNKVYGTVTLQPFESKILIRTDY